MKDLGAIEQKGFLPLLRAVLLGTIAGAAICAVLLAVCALAFVSTSNIPHDFLPAFILIVSMLSAFFSGFITAKLSKRYGLVCGVLSGLLLFLLFLVSGVSISKNGVVSESTTRLAVMLISGGIGGLLAVNGGFRRKNNL